MINELRLHGFKSFLSRVLKLEQLTILTGLNSSGKSSVIQALMMLEKSSSARSGFMLEGHGSLEEIRNANHNDAVSITAIDQSKHEFRLILHKNRGAELSGPFADFPEIIYVSASRFGPKSSVPIYNDNFKRNTLGPNAENLFQFIEIFEDEKLNPLLRHENSEGDTVLFNIRGWLSVISPNTEFKKFVNQASDTSYSTFNGYRSTNVGFGLSYSLPVIAALLIGTLKRNSLVIIENPEAHLHPKGQSEISKLISLCSLAGSQVIVETHSEHILDGVRIFAKKNSGFATNVQIHWFELDSNRNTEVQSPQLLENGKLSEWPKGMFEQFEMNMSQLM